jgi:hypothetical protein
MALPLAALFPLAGLAVGFGNIAWMMYDRNYPVITFDKRIRLYDPSHNHNKSIVQVLVERRVCEDGGIIVALVQKALLEGPWILNVYTARGKYRGTLWSLEEQFRAGGKPMYPEEDSWLESTEEDPILFEVEKRMSYRDPPAVTPEDSFDYSKKLQTQDDNAAHYIGSLRQSIRTSLYICLVDIKWCVEEQSLFSSTRREVRHQVVNAYHRDGRFFGTVILKEESHMSGRELATADYASYKDYSNLTYSDEIAAGY